MAEGNGSGKSGAKVPEPDKTIGEVINEVLKPGTSKKNKTQLHEVPEGSYVSELLKGSDLIDDSQTFGHYGHNLPPLPRTPIEREAEVSRRVKNYIGNISDEDFRALEAKMSKDILFGGMRVTHPSHLMDPAIMKSFTSLPRDPKLETHKSLAGGQFENKLRIVYKPLLKYSGDKASLSRSFQWMYAKGRDDLVPGKTVLYHVKVYRPFHGPLSIKEILNYKNNAHPVTCQQELVFYGGQTLADLRDNIRCPNDYGPRNDVSEEPDEDYIEYLKDVFPSGFLFLNNVFYNDMRNSKSLDYSEGIRKWAKERDIADLPAQSMEGVTFDSLEYRLGHPEVYVHQGNCEHLFTFTQITLLHPADVCVSSFYPINTPITNYRSNLCIICGGYAAQWIVIGSDRIPFEPAYLCSICFKQYNYIDGKKIGDFKAYRNFDKNRVK